MRISSIPAIRQASVSSVFLKATSAKDSGKAKKIFVKISYIPAIRFIRRWWAGKRVIRVKKRRDFSDWSTLAFIVGRWSLVV
ncbi:MAG: hypothetical protein V1775_00990 [Bacteroidota bacterium]